MPSYEQAEDILRDADTAMYRAKASGRARAQIFDADMHRSVVAQMKLEAELRKAIDRDLRVYYQPILSAEGRRLIGVEALLRWEHQRRGIIGPDEFMHIAEETGLIMTIGEQVLRTACGQVKQWIDAGHGDVSLFVNLSARQFQDAGLPAMIRQVLAESRLPGRALKLELTESVVMENAQRSIRTVKELNAIGIEVVLDDFGIGYSSMGQLKRFPLRMLKIDRSFIRDMPNDSESEAIVRATIAMAHSLKLEVVAEGVENESQLAVLLANEVDAVQGFMFSRPVAAKEIDAYLAANPLPCWPAQPLLLAGGGCLAPASGSGAIGEHAEQRRQRHYQTHQDEDGEPERLEQDARC